MLVLTGCRDRDLMMRTIRLGVHGFLRKTADTAEIVRAVQSLLRGESVFDSRARCPPHRRMRTYPLPTSPRAPRPHRAGEPGARLLAVGMCNREIGGGW